MGEELREPGVPDFLVFLFIEENSAWSCLGDEDRLADLPGEIDGRLSVLVSPPPRVPYPVVVFRSRVVLDELLRFGAAGGCVNRCVVRQLGCLEGLDDSLKSQLEVVRVIPVPVAIELVADADEEGVVGMIAHKVHQLFDQMIVASVRYLVLGISLHRDGEVHNTAVEGGGVQVSLLVHGTGGPLGFGV